MSRKESEESKIIAMIVWIVAGIIVFGMFIHAFVVLF